MAFTGKGLKNFRNGDTNNPLHLSSSSGPSEASENSPRSVNHDVHAEHDESEQSPTLAEEFSQLAVAPRPPNRSSRNTTPNNPNPNIGFRHSRTWLSRDTKEYQEYLVVRNAMRRLFKHSEVAQMKFADYIAHREAMVAARKEKLSRAMELKVEERKANVPPIQSLFSSHSELFDGNFSAFLRLPTIWCVDWQNGKDEVAPWPSYAEMKWEGDDRAKTGVGRFLPLPREMGAPGITWNQLQAIEQYPLDKTCLIPDMEDVYLPVDEIDDAVKYDLITKDLEEAIDAALGC
ncbi:hypothetical protein BDV96DRAFT_302644 [Lophiotrema nucula]|uniref:Uncharacterized protein n=1 Tax=Lophiotrema nucula TaxID=690887 RepID=A0A6A5YJV9_9PLEO|nr:hypothetical protein BDV96DRAFT_302644 [Lophiotrema nucula]